MNQAGVKVHAYHTLWESLLRLSLFRTFNRRNHRKLLVVDDSIAYFGGMNIVDQSGIATVDDAKARHLPPSGGWRDLHIRLDGPKHAEIADAMDHLWRRAHRQKVKRRPRWGVQQMLEAPPETISLFDAWPGRRARRAERVLLPLLRRARHTVTLSMAYFVPYGRVLRELVRARRRGVRVRVIVPHQSDVKIVQCASRHLYSFLLARGIRIYERKDCMLHSKVLVIDDEWTVVGSCNVDPRSLRLNLEFLGVIRAPALAAVVQDICRYDLRNSVRVTPASCRRRHWWQRLTDRAAWALRRWL
jgi:cardiolipin synthase